MGVLDVVHGGYVFKRRARILSAWLARMLSEDVRVLDVGCGDGLIAKLVSERRPSIRIEGIDTLVRRETHVPVAPYEGTVIPYGDRSFDVVMFVDVLHHTDDPMILLREAARVSRGAVLIKDHYRDGLLAGPTLRFMDWVGNARHHVKLPYTYWPERRWRQAYRQIGLRPAVIEKRLGLYPAPASWIFERSLHFIARLE